MSELFDDDGPEPDSAAGNAPVFSVTELSGAVKRAIEGGFGHVRVRGEVGRVSRPASGHLYLDLKDERAVLSSVIWKGTARSLATRPEEGMEVIATGRLTTFPGQSRYQLIIESIAPAGLGALMAMLEKRKAALGAEGLFDPARKRRPPYLPEVIGVITSPSGAVIRDILHRLRDRFPRRVLLWPVVVQGERCAPEVAAAIHGFNALPQGGPIPRPDVLIVARGGGSVEDLWGFNEEIVVRAAAASAIPLISAVGHETDTTLIDFAADLRAPTPTAAAELAVPVRAELIATLGAAEERRRRALARLLAERGQRLRDLSRLLPRPEMLVAERAQRLDEMSGRLPRALSGFTQGKRLQLSRSRAGEFGPRLLTLALTRKRSELGRSSAGRFGAHLLGGMLQRRQERLGSLAGRLSPETLLRRRADLAERLVERGTRFERAGRELMARRRERLERASRLLETLGYQRTLERGYAVVREPGGALVSEAERARRAPLLELEFRDGTVTVGTARPGAPRRKTDEDPQGSLF
ncbi:exodeoxyribonuclease VII large subunit [Paroceanicella profunda]|uniref:Exodeoxyribonuclease 7 large subunit n=1 Tax=Paroceanicella profunda TaxID=2579971 RepID=A0A5B8FYU8_9RHOB|nr:exodeoxyribonuclease VII large subunit [Paroceanicella profunda]QDL92834.1 exodeoxyribonuclease VII large subunit [Paroceanicella profunda]